LIKSEVSGLLWDIQLGTNFTTIPTPPQLTDAKAYIERRRKEELSQEENLELLYPLILEENPTREEKELIAKNKQDKKDRQERRDEINFRYDLELATLERPIEPEVTTNLNADEQAILSFDVSALENLESAAESLDQNTGQEIDNAGSCKL
jgi:hypothetical protein